MSRVATPAGAFVDALDVHTGGLTTVSLASQFPLAKEDVKPGADNDRGADDRRIDGTSPNTRKPNITAQALISCCGSRELMQTHAVVFDKYFRYALQYRGSDTAGQHRALGMRAERDIEQRRRS